MKTVRFEHHGKPDVLHVQEVADPAAGVDTAVVTIHAASINPSDVKNVAGRMSQTTLPRTPGRDYSGVVTHGPAQWLGAEVWGSGGDVGFTRDGTHAERIVVPAASLRLKPANLSHIQAAAIGVNFITAYCGLIQASGFAAGESLAIIGLGGVGGAAAQIARRIASQAGATAPIIGVARNQPPADAPVRGAIDRIVTPELGDSVEQVRALTGGAGVAVIFDTVGGSMFETALQMLRVRGRLIEISAGDRAQVSFNLADFYHNGSRLYGVDTLKGDLITYADILEQLRPGFEDGSYLPPVIEQTFTLDQVVSAYQLVEQGAPGRVVLLPQQ
jgi:NADPH2:quinone reductase